MDPEKQAWKWPEPQAQEPEVGCDRPRIRGRSAPSAPVPLLEFPSPGGRVCLALASLLSRGVVGPEKQTNGSGLGKGKPGCPWEERKSAESGVMGTWGSTLASLESPS